MGRSRARVSERLEGTDSNCGPRDDYVHPNPTPFAPARPASGNEDCPTVFVCCPANDLHPEPGYSSGDAARPSERRVAGLRRHIHTTRVRVVNLDSERDLPCPLPAAKRHHRGRRVKLNANRF